MPGVALTAEQMSQLTSDLVWLVEQTVTLADGSTQRVLVPQVYLVPREGDLTPSGSLIAGGRVEMALSGDFNNGGSVRGGDVSISAQNASNTGEMRGTTLALSAREDLRNIGGSLAATGDMSLAAGRDIVMETTTASGGMKVGNVTTKATVLDQVASLSVGGVMMMQAGRDVTLEAVKITQGGADGAGANGGVLISAGRDLTLSTVQTSSSRDEIKNANNYKKESQRQDVGTVLQAEGEILLKAGQDITATAAQISSAQGAVTLDAKRDVQLLAGEANSVVEEMTQKTKKSLFKKKTVTTYKKTDETTAIGTSVSGDTVTILSGQDITLEAAQAVSDHGTRLVADRDITIDGVTNSVDTEQFKKTVKSGLFSGGGLGVTIGKQELSQATKSRQETSQGSTVASVSGDVDITAGGKYVQIGSQVQAPNGNVSIEAKSIDILEARNQSAQDTETRFKQSGLTISLSVPGVDTALSAVKAAEHVTQTQDDRMKALAAATAISKANQALDEIKKFEAMKTGEQKQSIRVSISVGSSQSKSSQHNEADQAAGSGVMAGKALSIVATGADKDSNVTVRGSTLAGQDVLIKADNAINLVAAQNTSEQHSKESSSSASVGVGFSIGAENRFGVTVSGSVSKGNSDGKDTSFTTTKVTGGSSVNLQSGGDTALQGAVVSGPKVTADVGGNLKIESLQDTAKFDSKSTSAGGSATFGYGAGGSVNFSQSKVNADYAAVGEQAGVRAGDGGFQVTVKGNTDLKGGAITSSQAAIDTGKNSLTTGTLTSSDIDNRSQYSASAVTMSAGTSGGMAGAFKDSGDERSTTKSTISAGVTTITSGDASSQAALDKLDRGATNDATAGKLAQGWNGQELAQQAKVNAQIVAEFGAQAANEVAKRQDQKAIELRAAGNIEEAEKYEEGGEYRIAAHAVVGALTGGVGGALGAAASASLADKLEELQQSLEKSLTAAGLGPDKDGNNDWASGLARLASGALATGAALAAGGNFDAAAAGLNQDFNNRQLHINERKLIADLAEKKAKEVCGTHPNCDARVYGAALADAMQRIAEAAVDTEKASETAKFFAELRAIAEKDPSSVAALGGLSNYQILLDEAKSLLAPYVGKLITVNGQTVTAKDGSVQTYFKATEAQRNDKYLNAPFDKLPTTSIVPGMNMRDEQRVEGMTAKLGSAVPDTTLEELVLGAAVEKRIGKALGEWWKTLNTKGALADVIDADVQLNTKRISVGNRSDLVPEKATSIATARAGGSTDVIVENLRGEAESKIAGNIKSLVLSKALAQRIEDSLISKGDTVAPIPILNPALQLDWDPVRPTAAFSLGGKDAADNVPQTLKYEIKPLPLEGPTAKLTILHDVLDLNEHYCTGCALALKASAEARGDVVIFSDVNYRWPKNYDWAMGSQNIRVPGEMKPLDFSYHSVYTDGHYFYDPLFSASPVPKRDYLKLLKELNDSGVSWRIYEPNPPAADVPTLKKKGF